MTEAPQVSVIISTRNRASDLRDALESLLAQRRDGTTFEALIVDNDSSDDTRQVIESFAARSGGRIRYLHEPRPGVSFGRNTAIEAARAPIIAMADDDEILAPDWVANIKRALDANPDVDYLAGRMLPRFEAERPAWMTARNASACTIPDRGDRPIYGKAGCFFPGWSSGNLAIRREMLDKTGPFATDFPRGQDLELILRVWRAGGRGMYEPTMVVTHKVPRSRTTKAHHRAWHSREGIIRARVRYKELFDRDGRMVPVPRRAILGVPLFLLEQLARSTASWAGAVVRRDEADAFYYECETRQHFNYLWERARSRKRGSTPMNGAVAGAVSAPR